MKDEDVFTYLIGGKAGEGVKKAGTAATRFFLDLGRESFQMNDYQSLIRGGHNFSVVSTSTREVYSHHMEVDLIVNLDERSRDLHEEHLAKEGIMFYNSNDSGERDQGLGLPLDEMAEEYSKPDLIKGVAGIAVLAACTGMDKKGLEDMIKKEYSRGVEENLSFAKEVYKKVGENIDETFDLKKGKTHSTVITGNESLSLGAAAGGLDIYIGYPMTPASSILHFFATHRDDLNIMSIHPENEIAVANMAVGATVPGARVMVGSSGGGLALMEEAISLAGMTESPILFVLGSRPGPSTGVPTYTEQGDLHFALNQGHGEFPLIVSSPGCIEEAFHLSNMMLDLVWKYQTPGILLTEKHLCESSMSVDIDMKKFEEGVFKTEKADEDQDDYKRYEKTDHGISPLKYPPSDDLIKWNSYEHDEMGYTTEDPDMISEMHDKRREKNETLILDLKNINCVNEFGESTPIIFTYGSTTMSVREALISGDIDAKIVQPLFLNPFPFWELEEYIHEEVIVVEQSSTGQFASLLREKCRVKPKEGIRRYDGRPFEPARLAEKIEEAII